MTTLTGSEQVVVLGQTAVGGPSTDSFLTTAQAIANLSTGGGSLPAATTPLTRTETIAISQGGTAKKATPNDIINMTVGGGAETITTFTAADTLSIQSQNVASGASASTYIFSGNNTAIGDSADAGVGTGTTVTGNSGPVYVYTGDATTGNSGDAIIASGAAAAGTSGGVSISTGAGQITGHIIIGSSDSTAGDTGYTNIDTGNSTGGNAGDVNLQPGNASGAGKQAGNIKLQLGVGSASAANGQLILINFPTADPHIVNAVWVDTGSSPHTLRVSAG